MTANFAKVIWSVLILVAVAGVCLVVAGLSARLVCEGLRIGWGVLG